MYSSHQYVTAQKKIMLSLLYLFGTHTYLYTHMQNTSFWSMVTPASPWTRPLSPYLSSVVWTVGESLSNIVSGFSPFLSSSFCVSFTERLFITLPWRSFLPCSYPKEKKKESGVPFSKLNNDTPSRSLACVHSTNLHNNLSEVKGGRAERKISHMKERIKGRNVGR